MMRDLPQFTLDVCQTGYIQFVGSRLVVDEPLDCVIIRAVNVFDNAEYERISGDELMQRASKIVREYRIAWRHERREAVRQVINERNRELGRPDEIWEVKSPDPAIKVIIDESDEHLFAGMAHARLFYSRPDYMPIEYQEMGCHFLFPGTIMEDHGGRKYIPLLYRSLGSDLPIQWYAEWKPLDHGFDFSSMVVCLMD